jgi:hypothetical protein
LYSQWHVGNFGSGQAVFLLVRLSSFFEVLNGIVMGVDNYAHGNDLLENLSGDKFIR